MNQRERAVATVTVTDGQGRSESERTAGTLEELSAGRGVELV